MVAMQTIQSQRLDISKSPPVTPPPGISHWPPLSIDSRALTHCLVSLLLLAPHLPSLLSSSWLFSTLKLCSLYFFKPIRLTFYLLPFSLPIRANPRPTAYQAIFLNKALSSDRRTQDLAINYRAKKNSVSYSQEYVFFFWREMSVQKTLIMEHLSSTSTYKYCQICVSQNSFEM